MGRLGPWTLACHGTGLGAEDLMCLVRRGSALVHTPLADALEARGVAPLPGFLALGGRAGLGTGGSVCPDLDLFRTMGMTARLHKAVSGDPEAVCAETVVRMATIMGARALGLSGVTGSLSPGKRADIIVVSTSALRMQPMYNPFSHLVYAASGHDVVLTVIDGVVVMEDRRLTGMDPEPVLARARSAGLYPLKGDGEPIPPRR
jgi:5-methylthioadenosine/S-adenosylhomocysteine deaminase